MTVKTAQCLHSNYLKIICIANRKLAIKCLFLLLWQPLFYLIHFDWLWTWFTLRSKPINKFCNTETPNQGFISFSILVTTQSHTNNTATKILQTFYTKLKLAVIVHGLSPTTRLVVHSPSHVLCITRHRWLRFNKALQPPTYWHLISRPQNYRP